MVGFPVRLNQGGIVPDLSEDQAWEGPWRDWGRVLGELGPPTANAPPSGPGVGVGLPHVPDWENVPEEAPSDAHISFPSRPGSAWSPLGQKNVLFCHSWSQKTHTPSLGAWRGVPGLVGWG